MQNKGITIVLILIIFLISITMLVGFEEPTKTTADFSLSFTECNNNNICEAGETKNTCPNDCPLFVIAQITDLHMNESSAQLGTALHRGTTGMTELREMIDKINTHYPEVTTTIITGDVTNTGIWTGVKEELDRINGNYKPIMGNHDLLGNIEEQKTQFINLFGLSTNTRSIILDDTHLILILDCGAENYCTEIELNQMEEIVTTNPNKKILLFIHYYNYATARFWEIIKNRTQPTMLFVGHIHYVSNTTQFGFPSFSETMGQTAYINIFEDKIIIQHECGTTSCTSSATKTFTLTTQTTNSCYYDYEVPGVDTIQVKEATQGETICVNENSTKTCNNAEWQNPVSCGTEKKCINGSCKLLNGKECSLGNECFTGICSYDSTGIKRCHQNQENCVNDSSGEETFNSLGKCEGNKFRNCFNGVWSAQTTCAEGCLNGNCISPNTKTLTYNFNSDQQTHYFTIPIKANSMKINDLFANSFTGGEKFIKGDRLTIFYPEEKNYYKHYSSSTPTLNNKWVLGGESTPTEDEILLGQIIKATFYSTSPSTTLNITGKEINSVVPTRIVGAEPQITIPYCANQYSAAKALSEIHSLDSTCTEITLKWNPGNEYKFYSIQTGGNDFNLKKTEVYWLKCSSSTNTIWIPQCITVISIPECTENHWSYSLGECIDGNQLKTWTKISDCNLGITHPITENISCLAEQPKYCNNTDWNSRVEPIICPQAGIQTQYWTRTNTNCQGGITHQATETINCTYIPPQTTCTSFTYSSWSDCVNGTQKRNVLSASPNGCSGGNPITTQNCSEPCNGTICDNQCYEKEGICCNNNWNNGINSCTINLEEIITEINASQSNEAQQLLQQAQQSINNGQIIKGKAESQTALLKAKIENTNSTEFEQQYEQALLALEEQNYETAEELSKNTIQKINEKTNPIPLILGGTIIAIIILIAIVLFGRRKEPKNEDYKKQKIKEMRELAQQTKP